MDKYKEMFDGLSDDLKEKVTACKTSEELMNLAKSEGIELTDEQMDAISGGSTWTNDCKSYDTDAWHCVSLNVL